MSHFKYLNSCFVFCALALSSSALASDLSLYMQPSKKGAVMRVETRNASTVGTLYELNVRREGCDDTPPASEDWHCEESVEGKSNDMDVWGCRDQKNSWVCYETIKETCIERISGREMSRSRKEKTASCVELSTCF